MEDTQKKARDILLAAHHLRSPSSDITVDSPQIEDQRRRIIGLERMVLETQGFDFRHRHPHPFIIKFAKSLHVDQETTQQAWSICTDSYRTYIPLKQTPHTIALACLTLAAHFRDKTIDLAFDVPLDSLLATLDDLLDLYMHAKEGMRGLTVSETRLMDIKSSIFKDRTHLAVSGRVKVRKHVNLTEVGDTGTCRYLIDPDRYAQESRYHHM